MKKKYINMSVIAFAITASIAGCGSSSKPAKTALTKQGVWERKGYGSVIKVDKVAKVIKSYDFTRETCLESTISLMEIQTFLDKAKLSTDKNTLESDNIKVSRLDKLPQSCIDDRLITSATPTNTFEHLWHNFNDYYAFFDERNIDWAAQYSQYKPHVSEDMSEEELFQLMSAMLEPIGDGHVTLTSDEDEFDASKEGKFEIMIKEGFLQQDEFDDIDDYVDSLLRKFYSITESYLDTNNVQFLNDAEGDKIGIAGFIDGTIGYIQINQMSDFVSGDETDNVKAIHAFMQKAMKNFENTDGIIVDVRLNSGGHDAVSLAIASYFTDEKKKAYSKKTQYWDGETEELDFYVEPSTPSYLKPVIVIAGENTVSAGEIFLMAMSELSNVRLIGENSNGILSDRLEKDLPNGWEMSLSNEVYYDASGKKLEVVGIAPDINISVLSIEALVEGRDDAIETALQLLN